MSVCFDIPLGMAEFNCLGDKRKGRRARRKVIRRAHRKVEESLEEIMLNQGICLEDTIIIKYEIGFNLIDK